MILNKTALGLVAALVASSALTLTACSADVGESTGNVSEQEFTITDQSTNEPESSSANGTTATFQDVFGTTSGIVAAQDPIDNEPHPFPWKKAETTLQRRPQVQPSDPSSDHAASSTGTGSGSTSSTSDNDTPKP